jgi:hypothetical protein
MAAAAASTAAAATAAATAVAEALKPQKFIHALALVPASSMSIEQLGQLPEVGAVGFSHLASRHAFCNLALGASHACPT